MSFVNFSGECCWDGVGLSAGVSQGSEVCFSSSRTKIAASQKNKYAMCTFQAPDRKSQLFSVKVAREVDLSAPARRSQLAVRK